ncbi:hypothetical protein IJZ97_00470 [bacterium]|nr:hypothetical protein [bacterium]
MDERKLIKYFKSLGLEVHTSTKARGHQGFFLKNRIDISKNVPEHKRIQTLLHEFSHYIHSKIEPNIEKTGGTLEVLFQTNSPKLEDELLEVTHFVDENSLCKRLEHHKLIIKEKIKDYEKIIKTDYPKFLRSKRFKEFEKYIKKSDAKYLLKYDRIKLIKGFWLPKSYIYTIETIEKNFCDMPKAFVAYIRLHSQQKKLSRISTRINKSKKYYSKPTELFARFVEGLYIDKDYTKSLAPTAYEHFTNLLKSGYYKELKEVFSYLDSCQIPEKMI